jgi:hypothetical protein
MVSEENRAHAKELTNQIYVGYGSFYGVLFGIPPQFRDAVETVIAVVLEKLEDGD